MTKIHAAPRPILEFLGITLAQFIGPSIVGLRGPAPTNRVLSEAKNILTSGNIICCLPVSLCDWVILTLMRGNWSEIPAPTCVHTLVAVLQAICS